MTKEILQRVFPDLPDLSVEENDARCRACDAILVEYNHRFALEMEEYNCQFAQLLRPPAS